MRSWTLQRNIKSALPPQKTALSKKSPVTAFRDRIFQVGSHVLAILTECVATRRVDVELADCRRGSPSAVQKVRRPKSGSARAARCVGFRLREASAGGRGQLCSMNRYSTKYSVLSTALVFLLD